eukprot:283337-Chlamydomonas_euryale.AAC.2
MARPQGRGWELQSFNSSLEPAVARDPSRRFGAAREPITPVWATPQYCVLRCPCRIACVAVFGPATQLAVSASWTGPARRARKQSCGVMPPCNKQHD